MRATNHVVPWGPRHARAPGERRKRAAERAVRYERGVITKRKRAAGWS